LPAHNLPSLLSVIIGAHKMPISYANVLNICIKRSC
jgi:hypothetical protein